MTRSLLGRLCFTLVVGYPVRQGSHCFRLEPFDIGDVPVHLQVWGQVDAPSTRPLVFFLVNLDDANHGLAVNFWVVIDNDVEALINSNNSGCDQSLHVW